LAVEIILPFWLFCAADFLVSGDGERERELELELELELERDRKRLFLLLPEMTRRRTVVCLIVVRGLNALDSLRGKVHNPNPRGKDSHLAGKPNSV
jgi:hypothetical protein